MVITDEQASQEFVEPLKSAGVQLLYATGTEAQGEEEQGEEEQDE
jgi:hypothetical protein